MKLEQIYLPPDQQQRADLLTSKLIEVFMENAIEETPAVVIYATASILAIVTSTLQPKLPELSISETIFDTALSMIQKYEEDL